MSTPKIDSTAKAVVERFVKPSHPNGLQTNADDVGKRMNAASLNEVTRLLLGAGRSCFEHDEFSANIFEYMFNESFVDAQTNIFTAVLSSTGNDLAKVLKEVGSSTDCLAKIQEDDTFNIRVAPLHDEFKRRYETRIATRDKLRDAHMVHVIPAADAESWLEAVDWIIHNVKANMKKDELNELFKTVMGSALSADAITQIKKIKGQLQELRTSCNLKSIVEDLAHCVGTSKDERTNALLTGRIDKIVTWQKILNRMETVSQGARILTDFRRSSELASVKLFAPDFSVTKSEFGAKRSNLSAKVADISILGADLHDPNIMSAVSAAKMTKENIAKMNTTYQGQHLNALVAHILMYAGVDLEVFELTKVAGQHSNRPLSVVPLEWHSLSNFYKPFLRDMWKCFCPEAIELTFFTKLCDYASRNISKPISVSKARPELITALRSDLEKMVLAVKDLAYSGKGLNVDDVLKEYKRHAVQYTQEIISPFDDIDITTLTSPSDFALSSVIVADATRPVGTIVHPKAQGVGFEEAIIGRNRDKFGAITASASMAEIAQLYNRVSDYTSVSGEDIAVDLSIKNAIESALYDINRGALRIDETPIVTLRASEVIKDSHFARLGDDYYAFVAEKEDAALMLASGNTLTNIQTVSYGNIHGALSYSVIEPRGNTNITSDYDKAVVDIMTKATDLLIAGYIPRSTEVFCKTKATVEFAEENEQYAKRISVIPTVFNTPIKLDSLLLRGMIMSPMINSVFSDTGVATPDLLKFVNEIESEIRTDAYAHLDATAQRHVTVLGNTYSQQALKLFHAMLTRPLTVKEHSQLHRPEFAASAKAIAGVITETLKGFSDTLRAVYIVMLFKKLALIPDPSSNKLEGMLISSNS